MTERLDEQNIRDAITMAGMLFKAILDPEFAKVEPETRQQIIAKKYPNFNQAYPLITTIMARDLKYNENAFRKYLYKLRDDPGKGMEGFIACQANYVKFLYIEECKSTGRHWSVVRANQIWQVEYSRMNSQIKKIQEEEKKAKNEFAEEQQKNLEIKRQEFLDFINTEDPPVESKPIDVATMDTQDLILLIRSQLENRKSLFTDIKEALDRLTYYQTPEMTPEMKIETLQNNAIPVAPDQLDKSGLIDLIDRLNVESRTLENYLIELSQEYKRFHDARSGDNNPGSGVNDPGDDWLEGIRFKPGKKSRNKKKK